MLHGAPLPHRVGLGVCACGAPTEPREALGRLHRAACEPQIMVGAAKVQGEHLRTSIGPRLALRSPSPLPAACQQRPQPADRRQRPAHRTSSTELVLKLRSIAPATLPAARKGAEGQNANCAERCTLFSSWLFAIVAALSGSVRRLPPQAAELPDTSRPRFLVRSLTWACHASDRVSESSEAVPGHQAMVQTRSGRTPAKRSRSPSSAK